ncbi:MAG: gamma-glutamylcyclotransferase [Chitinophagales bacterium]
MPVNRVFVYGTLRPGLKNYRVVEKFVLAVYPATAQGRLFDLPYGYPAMIEGDGTVSGEVLELKEIRKALKVLDRLEGYSETSSRNLYIRVLIEVKLKGGDRVEAYTYYWDHPNELPRLGKELPEGKWGKK